MRTIERWRKVKEILDQALGRGDGERSVFLDEACAGDDDLRREVESLLGYEEDAETLSGAHLDSDPVSAPPSLEAGRRIGHYTILRELGRGGMGAVYLAARASDYRQQVALKLIKRGMDTDFALDRFRNERQILAALDHPNIARLLDGGATEDGSPYLVMEYIEGEPIDEYCRKRNLAPVERLKLFGQVCEAVEYAHRHLIIHRDIKPSNILVTEGGVPKLLDFGIAKLLTPELAAQTLNETAPALRLMTPAYASPEQVKGEPISTASDVYSLGVVLYELLTGRSPYRAEKLPPYELLRLVCEEEPEKPSTATTNEESSRGRLRHKLSGDVDNIALKALRKEPQSRYASVEQLRADIERYLNGQPVLARRGTFGYRAGKFIRRNKISIAAAALAAVAVAAGVTTTVIQRNRAERRFNDVRKLANAVIFDYQSALETLPGATEVRARMIKDSLVYLDSLASEAGDDPELQSELGKAYEQIGDIQGNLNTSNLNDAAAMTRSYHRSMELREAVLKNDPNNRDWRRELSFAYEKMGNAMLSQNDLKGALAWYEKGLAIVAELAKTDPDRLRHLATMHQLIGDVLGFPGGANLGDTKGALEHYRHAYEISKRTFDGNPNEYRTRWAFVGKCRSYASILNATGETRKALEVMRSAEKVAEDWVNDSPNDSRALDYLALTYDKLSDTLQDANNGAAALQYSRKALAIAEKLAAADVNDMQARRRVAEGLYDVGDLLASAKDQMGAEQSYQRALKISEDLLAANPANAELRQQLADGYRQFADVLGNAGKTGEALRRARKSPRRFLKNWPPPIQTTIARD